MELDELLISTGVDRLIKLVHDRKRVELETAAGVLHIEPTTVEDWAHVLEEDGIIKIEYQFTKVFLMWAAAPKKVLEEKLGRIEQRKGRLKKSISSMAKDADKKGKELESLEKDYMELYKTLDPKLLRISEHVEKLRKFEREKDAIYAKQLDRMENVRKKLDELAKSMEKAKVIPSPKERIPEEDIAYLKDYANELKDRMKEIDTSFKRIRGQIEKEKEKLGKLGEVEKVAEEVRKKISEIDSLKKRLVEAGKVVPDEKAIAEVRGALDQFSLFGRELKEEVGRIRADGEDILKSINKQVAAYDRLKAARKEKGIAKYASLLEKIRKEYKALSDNIDKTSEKVNATVYSYKEDIGGQIDDVRGTVEKLNKALSKKDEIKKIVDLISKLKKDQKGIRNELKLLSKEFEVLELRVGEGERMEKKAAGIRERIEITKEEQAKFEEKREDLRNLIRKMWEEEVT